MQDIVIDKPYRFFGPHHGRLWAWLIGRYLPRYLDRAFGIESVACRDVQLLRASIEAGHGIILAPNHSRPADPFVVGMLGRSVGSLFFTLASWHLFMQSRWRTWLIRRAGAFSIYREGVDRAAVNAAVDILEFARRPLVIFPEGAISRANEKLNNLQEGVAFIARSAARKRAKVGGRVVVHPVAIRYVFGGDLDATVGPVLDEIERRLAWRIQSELPIVDRIYRLGSALLALKEIEYIGQPQSGPIDQRLEGLINHVLAPLEQQWVQGRSAGSVIGRVKRLRAAILPDMIEDKIADDDHQRRWRQLADLYLAQQLSNYPPDYVRSRPSADRLLETVERFEEDLTDEVRVHRPFEVVVRVGEAIEVEPKRERGGDGDPLMQTIEAQLTGMITELSGETS